MYKYVILHVLFGIITMVFPSFFIIFTYFIFFYLLYFITTKKEKSFYIIITLSYTMMYEMCSRYLNMAQIIPWELGKYILVLFTFYSIFKKGFHLDSLTFFYLLGLIITLIINVVNLHNFIFNSLAITCWLISRHYTKKITLTRLEFARVVLAALLPLIYFLFAAMDKIMKFNTRNYNLQSKSVLGSLPANQISTYCGFAFFLIMVLLVKFKITQKYLFVGFALIFLGVGMLSFSRGGILVAVVCSLMLFVNQLRQIKLLHLIIFFFASISLFIYLDKVTNNSLLLRFYGETEGTLAGSKSRSINTITTGRFQIFSEDISVFLSNPIFGVGPGNASGHRSTTQEELAHIELSRLLSEQGIFGLIPFLIMILRLWKYKLLNGDENFIMGVFFIFGVLTTFHAATRTIVPILCMIIGDIQFQRDREHPIQMRR